MARWAASAIAVSSSNLRSRCTRTPEIATAAALTSTTLRILTFCCGSPMVSSHHPEANAVATARAPMAAVPRAGTTEHAISGARPNNEVSTAYSGGMARSTATSRASTRSAKAAPNVATRSLVIDLRPCAGYVLRSTMKPVRRLPWESPVWTDEPLR